MIVLHRITPWLIAAFTFFGFYISIVSPKFALAAFGISILLVALLYARLVDIKPSQFGFWGFVVTPVILTISSATLFLFLEGGFEKYVLAILTAGISLVFAEHLFIFFYQPARYRAFTLERFSLLIYVLTTFVFGSALFGFLLLLQTPLWLLVPIFFIVSSFIFYSMFWVAKINEEHIAPYAFGGSILLTELFVALSYLPTGYAVGGAILALFVYIFVGMVRAYFLDRLSKPVLFRYIVFTLLLLAIILATAQWV